MSIQEYYVKSNKYTASNNLINYIIYINIFITRNNRIYLRSFIISDYEFIFKLNL